MGSENAILGPALHGADTGAEPSAALVERVSRAIASAKRAPNLRRPEIIDKVWRAYCGQARAAIKEVLS